jgi:flagellar biosynthesis/type III secretory pathway chaperone
MSMGLDELSELLWHERRLLEVLLFGLEQEELLLSSGRSHWLGHMTAQVETALDRVRRVELGRAVEAQQVALTLGLEPDATLLGLAAGCAPPWDDLLREHHHELADLADRIRDRARGNRELLEASRSALDHALAALEDGVPTELRLDDGGDDDRLRDEVGSSSA